MSLEIIKTVERHFYVLCDILYKNFFRGDVFMATSSITHKKLYSQEKDS